MTPGIRSRLLPTPAELGLTDQLTDRKGRGVRRHWVLHTPSGSRTVAQYDRNTRALVKAVYGPTHIYESKPGLAWNYELLSIADRMNPRVKLLLVKRMDATPPDNEEPWSRPTYTLAFEVARTFALAAADGDTRYALFESTDFQVVLPWGAWRGLITEPPPIPEPVEPEGEPEQAVLL